MFRRRLAGLAWIPGAMSVLFLAGWANSVIVAIAGFVLLLVGLWMFAERGDRRRLSSGDFGQHLKIGSWRKGRRRLRCANASMRRVSA